MVQVKSRNFFEDLSRSLKELHRRKIAKQADIEAATGVDQTVISRAKNKHLKRITPAIEQLKKYADMRLSEIEVRAAVVHAALDFYGAGGTEEELIASIKHVTELIGRRSH